jgi:hypothetical protein
MIAQDDRIDPDNFWEASTTNTPVYYHLKNDNHRHVFDRRMLPIDTLQILEKMDLIEEDIIPF